MQLNQLRNALERFSMYNMIALEWDKDAEKELLANGFEKNDVWLKYCPTLSPTKQGEGEGEAEIWGCAGVDHLAHWYRGSP
jgi:hypothetical protein